MLTRMELRRIDKLKDFKQLAPIWDNLLAKSGVDNFFLCFDWLFTWWKVFGAKGQLMILLCIDGETTLGIAPLCIRKYRLDGLLPYNVLSFLGEGLSDYADFIVCDRREEVLKLFLQEVRRLRRHWHKLSLVNFPENSPNFQFCEARLRALLGKLEPFEEVPCPFVTLKGEWEDYYHTLSKSLRQDIRTQHNKLKREGISFEFVRKSVIDELELGKIANIHMKKLKYLVSKGRGNRSNMFQNPIAMSFLEEVLPVLNHSGKIDFAYISFDGEIAAYVLGFKHNRIHYFWNTGYTPQFSNFSPGKILLYYLIEHHFRSGYWELDFLRVREEYKTKWATGERFNHGIVIKNYKYLYPRMVNKLIGLREIFRSVN